jgi:hypothetical protein
MSKIVQFPTVPAGARAANQMLRALYQRDLPEAPAKPPSEADMVDDDGNVQYCGVQAVARWRAMKDFYAYADMGQPVPYSELYAKEYRDTLDGANIIAALRRARAVFQKLPLRELEKAENGLGMPYDAAKVADLKRMIDDARRFPYAQE